jgi:hypothetical protein
MSGRPQSAIGPYMLADHAIDAKAITAYEPNYPVVI